MNARLAFCKDENGQTAAEFALVLIVFLALVFGTLGLSFAVWANETLQFATEAAARCASVTPTVCNSQSTVQSYGTSHYSGPNIFPITFNYSKSGSCGNQVTATATIPLDAVVVDLSVPLSASACFP
jgi:Flp pilus assembly protein TadG